MWVLVGAGFIGAVSFGVLGKKGGGETQGRGHVWGLFADRGLRERRAGVSGVKKREIASWGGGAGCSLAATVAGDKQRGTLSKLLLPECNSSAHRRGTFIGISEEEEVMKTGVPLESRGSSAVASSMYRLLLQQQGSGARGISGSNPVGVARRLRQIP